MTLKSQQLTFNPINYLLIDFKLIDSKIELLGYLVSSMISVDEANDFNIMPLACSGTLGWIASFSHGRSLTNSHLVAFLSSHFGMVSSNIISDLEYASNYAKMWKTASRSPILALTHSCDCQSFPA